MVVIFYGSFPRTKVLVYWSEQGNENESWRSHEPLILQSARGLAAICHLSFHVSSCIVGLNYTLNIELDCETGSNFRMNLIVYQPGRGTHKESNLFSGTVVSAVDFSPPGLPG